MKIQTIMLAWGLPLVAMAAHNFGDETIAFFPFDDGPVGSSAAGVTLKNAITEYSSLTGRVETVGDGYATFSDEAPGEYIFTNLVYDGSESWNYRNPKSIYINSTTINNNNRAVVFFDELVKKAQELDASKIELWYKFDENAQSGWEPGTFRIYGGWNKMSGDELVATNGGFSMMWTDLGNATTKSHMYGQIFWTPLGQAETKSNASHAYGPMASLKDGKWHHLMFSAPYASYNGVGKADFAYWHDGQVVTTLSLSNVGFVAGAADVPRPMVFNTKGNFRGWISCVRLSRGSKWEYKYAKPQWDIVRPSSLPTCAPRAYVHYRFEDQTAGQPLAATIANLSSYNAYNPNIFAPTRGYVMDWRRAGRVPGTGEVLLYGTNGEEVVAAPTATNDVKRRFVHDGKSDAAGVTNALSGKFDTAAVSAASDIAVGYGVLTRVGTYLQPYQESQTVEMFFKFDYDLWKSRVGSTATCREVQLMWITCNRYLLASDQYNETFGIALDLTDEKNPKIGVRGYTGTLEGAAASKLLDGKWHHVAATFEMVGSSLAKCNLWLDYAKLMTDQYTYFFFSSGEPGFTWVSAEGKDCEFGRNVWFARSDKSDPSAENVANAHGFPGELDEIRLSWGVLTPDEFLKQRGGGGAVFTLR